MTLGSSHERSGGDRSKMSDVRFVKRAHHWELGPGVCLVTRCSFDYEVTILLQADSGTSVAQIAIGSRFALVGAGAAWQLDPEGDPAALAPVLQLVRRRTERVRAFNDGRLECEFEGGYRLAMPPGDDYESWAFSGSDRSRIVSMPGGNLGIWDAR